MNLLLVDQETRQLMHRNILGERRFIRAVNNAENPVTLATNFWIKNVNSIIGFEYNVYIVSFEELLHRLNEQITEIGGTAKI